MFLVAIPIVLLVLYFATVGAAQVSAMTGKAHVGFLSQFISAFFLPERLLIKGATLLAKYIATSLEPAYEYSAKIMARFLSGLGQTIDWNSAHAHRNSSASYNIAWWANTKLRAEITNDAIAHSGATITSKIATTAPSVKVQRITSKQTAVQFRHALDSALPGALVQDYPAVNWTAAKWRRWLGVVPAVGTVTLPSPGVIPRAPAIPKKQTKLNESTEKRLKRLEKLLGIAGLSALVGVTFGKEIERFLKCGNTRGIAKAWCGANLNALLGLLTGLLAAVGVFSLIDFAHYIEDGIEDGAKLVLHFWSKDVASGIDQNFGDGGVSAKRNPSFGSA